VAESKPYDIVESSLNHGIVEGFIKPRRTHQTPVNVFASYDCPAKRGWFYTSLGETGQRSHGEIDHTGRRIASIDGNLKYAIRPGDVARTGLHFRTVR
jgi:hypothetical protein